MYQLQFRPVDGKANWEVFEYTWANPKVIGEFVQRTTYDTFAEVEAAYKLAMVKGWRLRIVRVELMREGASPWPWELERDAP